MTKLPQAPKMGVGVHEVVEMYATSLCDTEPIAKKDPGVSSSCGQDIKRRLSELTEDSSPQSLSPGSLHSQKGKLSDSSPPSPGLGTDVEEITKRARLESPAILDAEANCRSRESYSSRRKRFLRTAEALRQSGLLDITMKTAELLRKNHKLQREIEDLQRQTKKFVFSVLSNPENRHILDNIRSGAQLYEVVVPGSQGIMSVSTQQTDVNMNLSSERTEEQEEEDNAMLLTTQRTDIIPSSTMGEADSGLSNPSPHSNFSSPSPASSESSLSSDTSSLSNDSDSSEEENLSPPKLLSSYTAATAADKPH